MIKKNVICFYFVIIFSTLLLNEKRVFSQENGDADLSKESGDAGDSICEIASREVNLHSYDGKLSDYWAQEYIGSDLFREEFSDWLKENPPPTNLIAITDTPPNDSHGFLVTNLISHQNEQAILPHLKIRNFWIGRLSPDLEYGRGLSVVSNLLAGQPPFSFINNSVYWGSLEEYLGYKEISDRGSIIVSASGNRFPFKMSSAKRKAGENLNIIIVGSLRPSGLMSNFSQEDELISISAPSNHEILSIGMNGEERLFSGTSGAVPLVTGSLAAFEWITNYHPTVDELKLLLKKTAIPSLMSHQRPSQNGDGTVNAYKIARVAEKISLNCQNEDPQERVTCVQESINRNETYQFPEFSRNDLTDTLNEYFPECLLELELGESTGSPNVVCENKKEAIKKLRREALLNPYNKNLWKALSCIYKKGDFLFNSIYYNITALATDSPIDRDEILSAVKEAFSVRAENFSQVLKNENLSNEKFIQTVEVNLSFELMMMFRIRSSFFPDTLSSLLKEKLQFFESYEYVNLFFKEEHLSLVMHLSGLLNRREDRAFFQTKGFSRHTLIHPEGSYQDSPENHLKICELIDSYVEKIRVREQGQQNQQVLQEDGREDGREEEREVPLNFGYKYPGYVRVALIESSVFLENEDEKWNLIKKGLADENVHVRRVAIEHFYTLEDEERKLQVLNCLKDSIYHLEDSHLEDLRLESLYRTITRLLTSLKDKEKKENLFIELLSNEDQSSHLGPFVVEALWSLSEDTRSKLLRAYFNHGDPILRKAVISSLWILDSELEIEGLLRTALNDEDFNVKSSAFLSIGSLSRDEKKTEFIDLAIENPNPRIKAISMDMIWFLAEPSLVNRYFDLGFQHLDFAIRNAAIRQIPYLDKNLQQKIDLFKLGMKDSNSTVQLTAIKFSLNFSKRIREEAQLVDLYKTILSTTLSLLDQKYEQRGVDSIIKLEAHEYLEYFGSFFEGINDPVFATLKTALRNTLVFFVSFQNKDWQLGFLNFFEEALENTELHDVVKAIYILSALSLVGDRQNVYFQKDENQIVRIGLIKLLDEMIASEKNLGNVVLEIVDLSLVFLVAATFDEVELREVLFNLLKQGLKYSEGVMRIEILRKIFLSEFFDQASVLDDDQQVQIKNQYRLELLDLLIQELSKLKGQELDRLGRDQLPFFQQQH